METLTRDTSLRLLAAMLTIMALAVAGFLFWRSGHSERHIPEGAYLVQTVHRQSSALPHSALPHTGLPPGGD